MASETETDDTEIEETDTELEFRELHAEAIEQIGRLNAMADHADKASPQVAPVLREMSGTVLALLRDLVAACGGTLHSFEERLEDLEQGSLPAESYLIPEDAADFLAYLEQVKKALTELITLAAEGGMSTQKEVFETLLRMTEDRIAFTRSISGDAEDEGDEGDEDDEQPPAEGEGVGQA